MINKLQAIALFGFSLISHLSLVAAGKSPGIKLPGCGARNASGGVVASQSIKVRFSVRTGSSAGPVQHMRRRKLLPPLHKAYSHW